VNTLLTGGADFEEVMVMQQKLLAPKSLCIDGALEIFLDMAILMQARATAT
jgi:hypothetical protein